MQQKVAFALIAIATVVVAIVACSVLFMNQPTQAETIEKYAFAIGDDDIVVVCEDENCPISSSILEKSFRGAREAYDSLINFTGIDFRSELKPIHVHLMGDCLCGSAEWMNETFGYITGFATVETEGKGAVCLFLYENNLTNSLMYPFNEENADNIQAQLLLVHELTHLLFAKTSTSYALQEDFCKAISFKLTGVTTGCIAGCDDMSPVPMTSACNESALDYCPLNYYLCKDHGFDFDRYGLLFGMIDESFGRGHPATDSDVKDYISSIMNEDVSDSFGQVGILIG
jgi:hypothetical protein